MIDDGRSRVMAICRTRSWTGWMRARVVTSFWCQLISQSLYWFVRLRGNSSDTVVREGGRSAEVGPARLASSVSNHDDIAGVIDQPNSQGCE